jgi:hypothetical protein
MEQISEPRAEYARGSAASWGAIIAGAFVATAVSLVLFVLGSGLGFASISPWPARGVSATTFAASAAIWLIVMQWIASGLGGYITGRLRTRWVGTHTHEVFFRDTAHGFVTWAVATVLVAVTLATSLFSAIGGRAHPVSATGAATAAAPGMMLPTSSAADAYAADKLLRSLASAGAGQASSDPRAEADHIASNAWATGSVPDADRTYLTELVAMRTGASAPDARKRVDDFVADTLAAASKFKNEAEAARKTAAHTAIYMALAMLVGAFIASVSAALGGRVRDEHL